MKNLTLQLMMIYLALNACSSPSSENRINNVELNSLPDTAGYYAARNMKGLASFKLGESKYKEILNLIKEEIRKDSRRYKETNYKDLPRYSGYQEKYLDFRYDKNGNISSQFYREDFGSIFKEIQYDTLISYLKDDILNRKIFGCPDLREFEMFEYYVGDIEIRNLKLTFYKEILYKISCGQNEKIEEGFNAKYGNGKLINNSIWKTPNGETNVRPENDAIRQKSVLLKIDKKLIWENKYIKAESQTYCEYKYEGETYKGAGYSNSYFYLTQKNDKLVQEIRDCENNAYEIKKRLEEQKNQKDINRL